MLRHCSIMGLFSVVACSVVCGITTFSSSAAACSYAVSGVLETDPALLGQDDIAPQLLDVEVQQFSRGHAPTRQLGEDGAELLVVSSCGDIARMVLAVVAEDEQTTSSDLRYTVKVVHGEAPMQFESGAFATVREGELLFAWGESPKSGELPLNFELRVTAVDQAGNESEPFFVSVTDPGTLADSEALTGGSGTAATDSELATGSPERPLPKGTCSTANAGSLPAGTNAATVFSLLALAALLRRRK